MRRIKRPVRGQNNQFKRFSAIGLSALVASGIGLAVKKVDQMIPNKYVIAVTRDSDDDDYEGSVPLIQENGDKIEINKDMLVIVEKNIKPGKNKVYTLGGKRVVSGTIKGKYLDETGIELSKEEAKEYNNIFKVTSDALLRDDTSSSYDSEILGQLSPGEFILGADELITKNDEVYWRPVIYVNEEGIKKGYIQNNLIVTIKKYNDAVSILEEDTIKHKPKMQVDTDMDSGVPLHLRSNPEINSENVITEIPNGSIVYPTNETQDSTDGEWLKVQYIDFTGNEISGWVLKQYLDDIGTKMIVDTSEDGGVPLHLRNKPSINAPYIYEIENGSEVEVASTEIDKFSNENDIEWIKLNNPIGYVQERYLKQIPDKDNLSVEVKNVITSLKENNSSRITGIDVSQSDPEQILSLYRYGISQNNMYTSIDQEDLETYPLRENMVDITDINGKINFVYIELGASIASIYNENGEIDMTLRFKDMGMSCEQVTRACEYLKIPYGFYYYSTATTRYEADQEYQQIVGKLNELKLKVDKDLKYNMLPLAIDIENIGESDRQYGRDIKEMTDAKAYLCNSLEPITGKAILYGSGSAITELDGLNLRGENRQLIDLNEFKKYTGINKIWLSTPKESVFGSRVGGDNLICINLLNSDLYKDIDIIMNQEILDGRYTDSNGNNIGPTIDIDTISKDNLIDLLIYRMNEKNKTIKSYSYNYEGR